MLEGVITLQRGLHDAWMPLGVLEGNPANKAVEYYNDLIDSVTYVALTVVQSFPNAILRYPALISIVVRS